MQTDQTPPIATHTMLTSIMTGPASVTFHHHQVACRARSIAVSMTFFHLHIAMQNGDRCCTGGCPVRLYEAKSA